MWRQKTIHLQAKARGFHLITREIIDQLPELSKFKVGQAHLFINQAISQTVECNLNRR